MKSRGKRLVSRFFRSRTLPMATVVLLFGLWFLIAGYLLWHTRVQENYPFVLISASPEEATMESDFRVLYLTGRGESELSGLDVQTPVRFRKIAGTEKEIDGQMLRIVPCGETFQAMVRLRNEEWPFANGERLMMIYRGKRLAQIAFGSIGFPGFGRKTKEHEAQYDG